MSSSPVNQARAPAPIADSSHPAPARVAFVRSELYNELASTLQHLGKRLSSLLSLLTSSWLLESHSPTHPPPLTSATGRRTLMADAAVIACGFLEAPNVTAVELTPVPPLRSSHVPHCAAAFTYLGQASEDDLQAFHSDDYLHALKTAHATLTARNGAGCSGLSELEDFGLFVPFRPPATRAVQTFL